MYGRRKREATAEAHVQAGIEARRRRDHDTAARELAAAAELGHPVGLFEMGVAAERDHHRDEARGWFERALAAGHPLARKKLDALDGVAPPSPGPVEPPAPPPTELPGQDAWDRAEDLRDRGRLKDAREWLERAHEEGHPRALDELADLLPMADPRKDELYRTAAESGDRKALRRWGDQLADTGRYEEAIPVWGRLEAAGDYWGTYFLGVALEQVGRPREAMAAFRRGMREPRLRSTAAEAYGTLRQQGVVDDDPVEGEALLRKAGRAGAPFLAEAPVTPADPESPEPARPDPERDWATELLEAWQLECRGEVDAAEERYRDLALGADDPDAMAGLARVLELRGETSEARRWRDEAEAYGAYLDRP